MAATPTSQRPGALILGASSGIGAALARQLVTQGYRVALVARRADQLASLATDLISGLIANAGDQPVAVPYVHDVADYAAAPDLFARITNELAPLRLVIYAAGVMPSATTGVSFADERAMMEINAIAAMRWLGLAAEHLERAGGGTLVGVSSVAGDRGRSGNGAYMASKAALSSYLDSLRFRLAPRGVHVLTVKPGYVATAMTEGARLPKPLTISADAAAATIARAIQQGKNGVAYVPAYWRPIMWLVRRLPAAVVVRMP
jgi:short-subunit dehydrogenase